MIGSISLKQILKIGGTLLILFGIFGYLFPEWQGTVFNDNENLFHVLTGLLAIATAQLSPTRQRLSLAVMTLLYLALGIYGFSFKQPMEARIGDIFLQLDAFDNYLHIIIGLIWGWFWFNVQKT